MAEKMSSDVIDNVMAKIAYKDGVKSLPMAENNKAILEPEIVESIAKINLRLTNLEIIANKRIEAIKQVILNYLEASSNIALATVKANLKNI